MSDDVKRNDAQEEVTTVHTVRAVSIALLVLAEVGLWQWRMVIAARGLRGRAMTLGALGAVLQVTALSQVVTDVHDPLSIGAYAVGVGLGVLLGLVVGDRLTPGMLGVTVITTTPGVATRAVGARLAGHGPGRPRRGRPGHRPVRDDRAQGRVAPARRRRGPRTACAVGRRGAATPSRAARGGRARGRPDAVPGDLRRGR